MKIALQDKRTLKFVCAENGGDDAGIVNVNREAIGPWETLTVWQLGDGFVALETSGDPQSGRRGRFLSHIPGDENDLAAWLVADRARKSDTSARADLRNVPDDVVSLAHDAWEAFKWSDLQGNFKVTIVEGGSDTAPELTVNGQWFYVGDTRTFLNGTDQFIAYERFRNGNDLSALFQESRELGFWIWRVFLMATWTVHPQDDDLSQLGPFVDLLNQHGIIPQVEVLADCQVLLPNKTDRQNRWRAVCDRLDGKRVLISMGNEADKNGFDPGELSYPPSSIWSRGSMTGDRAPYKPEGNYNLFHPRRDYPKMVDDSVATATFLFSQGYTRPLVMDEGIGFASYSQAGRRSNDPELARRLAGHYALEWAGAYFHNEPGMSCIPMDDHTRRCAEAWSGTVKRLTT